MKFRGYRTIACIVLTVAAVGRVNAQQLSNQQIQALTDSIMRTFEWKIERKDTKSVMTLDVPYLFEESNGVMRLQVVKKNGAKGPNHFL